ARQDRENINKTSAFPHESSQRVTSLDADEGSMQQRLQELMKLCTSLQRQQTQMAAKITDQDLEISGLKARVKFLEDKDRGRAEPTQEDAPIKGGIIEIEEEQMRSPIIGAKDKGKQKVVESKVPKKRKIQEQIDAQVAREMEEEFARENKRLSEQLARDSEIERLHAEEELKMMIKGLYRSNEVITKYLQEYEQAAADLTVREKIELINELVKYQDHHAKILKYQAQQSKPLSKKEQREFYMSKFIPVWKQLEDYVLMSSKEKGERVKRKGLKLDQRSYKRMKTSKDVSEVDLKGMMHLVPLEEVYVEALQVKHPIIDWEIHSEEKRESTSAVDFGEGNFKYQTSYKRQGEGVMGRAKEIV
nr:hypothetical protein [Tanacetum cinerariifolium]